VTPYFDDGKGRTIYLGDCREILPTISGDIVVTSPPYNTLPIKHAPSGLHAERKSGVNAWILRAASGYADTMPEEDYQSWLREIVGLCLQQVRGLVWINHKLRFRDGEGLHPLRFLPFALYSEIIWDRQVSMALNCRRHAPSHEALWAFGAPHWWSDIENKLMTVWRIGFDRHNNDHPCAFPMPIAMRPIAASCPPGGCVVDPFMGSGTTLVAAKELGRKAVGIEIVEKYCEVAARRLEQEVFDFRETPA
jgi:site-specific DNA-methyltransferase (adenine-specific)